MCALQRITIKYHFTFVAFPCIVHLMHSLLPTCQTIFIHLMGRLIYPNDLQQICDLFQMQFHNLLVTKLHCNYIYLPCRNHNSRDQSRSQFSIFILKINTKILYKTPRILCKYLQNYHRAPQRRRCRVVCCRCRCCTTMQKVILCEILFAHITFCLYRVLVNSSSYCFFFLLVCFVLLLGLLHGGIGTQSHIKHFRFIRTK